jgi:hypothetical protein
MKKSLSKLTISDFVIDDEPVPMPMPSIVLKAIDILKSMPANKLTSSRALASKIGVTYGHFKENAVCCALIPYRRSYRGRLFWGNVNAIEQFNKAIQSTNE